MCFSKKSKKLAIGMASCLVLIITIAMTMPGCGESDSDNIDNSAKVRLNDANAETLLKGVILSTEVTAIPPVGSDVQSKVKTSFAKMKTQAENFVEDSKLSVSGSGTIDGSCGGSVTLSGNVNNTSADFKADYNAYCTYVSDVNENVTYDGSIDIFYQNITENNGTEILNFEINYNNTSMAYPEFSAALDGSASLTLASFGAIEGKYNMTIQDTITNKATIYKDFSFVVSALDDTMSFSGYYSHPDYGYVQVSTPELITSPAPGTMYGRLHIEGADGESGSPSTADLVFNGTSATLEVDVDGDGTVDYTEIVSNN